MMCMPQIYIFKLTNKVDCREVTNNFEKYLRFQINSEWTIIFAIYQCINSKILDENENSNSVNKIGISYGFVIICRNKKKLHVS